MNSKTNNNIPFMKADIKDVFASLPQETHNVCKELRALIFKVANQNPDIGVITETLKWGEPAYLSKNGSTLRLWKTKENEKPALFVNCKTSLIERFKELYPQTFEYQTNRAVVILKPVKENQDPIEHIITLTLTYHNWKQRN